MPCTSGEVRKPVFSNDFFCRERICAGRLTLATCMAVNTSEKRRILLDFVIVDPTLVPGTHCRCILPEVGDRRLKLSEYKTWTGFCKASAADDLPEETVVCPCAPFSKD